MRRQQKGDNIHFFRNHKMKEAAVIKDSCQVPETPGNQEHQLSDVSFRKEIKKKKHHP
jgi:hypothetical protein